jgi:hypothetical protein
MPLGAKLTCNSVLLGTDELVCQLHLGVGVA